MTGRKTNMVAADHQHCLPGAGQRNRVAWLFYQPNSAAKNWRGKINLQTKFFLKQPQQTIPKGIVSSQPPWLGLRLQRVCRASRPTSNQCHGSGQVKQGLLEHWPLLEEPAFFFVPSHILCLSWLLQFQRKTPSSCICTKTSTIRPLSSPHTNTAQSNNQRIHSKTSPDRSSPNALHWEFGT